MTSVAIDEPVFLTGLSSNQSRSPAYERNISKAPPKKQQLRPDSPTTLLACKELGITQNELKQKTIEDFKDPAIEEEIVQLRYQHYLKRYNQTLKDIASKKRKILRRLKNQQPDQLTSPETTSNNYLTAYHLPTFRVPKMANTAQSFRITSVSPLTSNIINSMSQNFNKTMTFFKGANDGTPVQNFDQNIQADEGQLPFSASPVDRLSKTLSQELFKFNKSRQQKQKEAKEIYIQEMKRIKMMEEMEERDKKFQEKRKLMMIQRKKKEIEKKKAQEEKAEKIKDLERNFQMQKEEEKEKMDHKLQEAQKNFEEEIEERNKKIAEKEAKEEAKRRIIAEKREKLKNDELKMTEDLKANIEGKMIIFEEKHQTNLLEKSQKLKTQLARIEENIEKAKGKKNHESQEYVQSLIEKLVKKEEIMQAAKEKEIKEMKKREAESTLKDKKFFTNQERLEEKYKDRMDEINERFKKAQEMLEAKRVMDEKHRKFQQEIRRLKMQDKLENHHRIELQMQNERLKVFDKEKQIQERIFCLNTEKELSLQAKLEVAIKTKFERERIDDAITKFVNGGIKGVRSHSGLNRKQKIILRNALNPDDFRMLEEEERKKENGNKSQIEDGGNSPTKAAPLNKKAH